MDKHEAREKANLLKDSLRIVDKLGDMDIDDYDSDELEELMNKARKLKKNRYWKLT